MSERHGENLHRVARNCQVISQENLNHYLEARLETVSSVTVANERRMLLTLWSWAYDNQLVDEAPRGILRIRSSRQSIRAWTGVQVKKIIAAARVFPGRFRCGLAKRFFMTTWAYLGYETGARWGDLWDMRFDQVEVDTIRWSMNKTGDPMHRRLSVACLVEAERLRYYSPDGRILGWACKKRYAMRLWKTLCDSAGVDGTSKWLRRSGATHVEREAPGKGRVFLGHRTHRMAELHYIDRAQIQSDDVLVPSLG